MADSQSASIRLEESWKKHLACEFDQPYMQNLKQFLQKEVALGKIIYPSGDEIFQAFALTPFDQVKVVIVGQDPYHGPGQAHGLSFSVKPGVAIPPSLQNIYKELETDVGMQRPSHGHLVSWAVQGVLLLNAVLTVEQAKAAAHRGRGWEQFTDKVIHLIDQYNEHVVFLLWGSYAIAKGQHINREKHLVLTAAHPSPLSAYKGFLGCRHFSQANAYLEAKGKEPIDWSMPRL